MAGPPLQRVLFVDDDEVVQRLVQLSLERIGGLTVRLVSEGDAALEAIRSFKPDLVVLDWFMPGADGKEVFRRMQESEDLAHLPVVFMTVRAHWRQVEELLELGAAGVITKPFAARELSAQLQKIWNERKA